MYYEYLDVDYSIPPDLFLENEIKQLFDEEHLLYVSRYKIIGTLAHKFEEAGHSTPLTRLCKAIFNNRYLSSSKIPIELTGIRPEIQTILNVHETH